VFKQQHVSSNNFYVKSGSSEKTYIVRTEKKYMKVSVYIIIEMYKGEKTPLPRIDSSAWWDKEFAQEYVDAQNAHLKELHIESSLFSIKEVQILDFPFMKLEKSLIKQNAECSESTNGRLYHA